MWICLSDAFFSIVAHKDPADDRLVVRARRKGDIERIFGVAGQASPGRDYAYRVYLSRDTVAAVMMCQVLGITATNFKDSVKDPALHSAYNRVWGVMGDLQVGGPYGNRRPPSRKARHAEHNYGPREAAERVGYRAQRSLGLPTMTEEEAADLPAEGMPDGDPLEALRYLNR